MRAVAYAEGRGLVDLELPAPVPGSRDLLVEVRAVAVNPVDLKVRARTTGAPRVLGWDAAGIVVDRGDQVAAFDVGDEVYFAGDITRAGANSELCLVDERIAARKPTSLGFAEAAALPLTSLTAYEALRERLHLGGGAGKTLLVVGGGGGVGAIAIQLAKVLTEVTVIATASRDETARWCRELGADAVVDHRRALRPQIDRPVDYILCTADTDPYYAQLVELVAPFGALCFLVTPSRAVDMAPLQPKSATVAWELMFTRSMFQTPDMAEQRRILTELAELVDRGRVRTTLRERSSPICAETLSTAHARIETGTMIGKLVIEGWG